MSDIEVTGRNTLGGVGGYRAEQQIGISKERRAMGVEAHCKNVPVDCKIH